MKEKAQKRYLHHFCSLFELGFECFKNPLFYRNPVESVCCKNTKIVSKKAGCSPELAEATINDQK